MTQQTSKKRSALKAVTALITLLLLFGCYYVLLDKDTNNDDLHRQVGQLSKDLEYSKYFNHDLESLAKLDSDSDGVPDIADEDIDNDGTANSDDPDTDGDGTPNSSDPISAIISAIGNKSVSQETATSPAGANGRNGQNGANGPQGQNGLNGIDGSTGPSGPQGIPGTVGVVTDDGVIQTSLTGSDLDVQILLAVGSGLQKLSEGLSLTRTCATNQILKWTGSSWDCGYDEEGISYSAGAGITITSGVITSVLGNIIDGSEIQNSSVTNNHLSTDSVGNINIIDNAIDSGKILDSSINFVDLNNNGCASGEIIKFSGISWSCGQDIDTDTDTTYSAGQGLSLVGTEFSIEPSNLSAISSVINSDVLVIGTSAGAKKITYNDLFGNILGALNYRGTWNPSINSPDLTTYCNNSTKGHYFVASSTGNSNLDGFNSWVNNDWAICDGTQWQQIQSLNSVSSVFGRTGAVTAQYGDYTADKILNTPSGNISSTNVQSALNELAAESVSNNLGSGLIYIGNSSNMASAVAISGDITLLNTGVASLNSNTVDSSNIINGSILTEDIANSAITNSLLSDSSVTSQKILDGTISTADLAGLSVTTDILANGSVSEDKLAVDSISTTKLKDGAIITSKLSDGVVTTVKIATDAITTNQILDGTISSSDLATSSVTVSKIQPGAANQVLVTDTLGNVSWVNKDAFGAIADGISIAGSGTTADPFIVANLAITTAKLADGSVTGSKLADGAVSTAKLADSSISTLKLIDSAITAAKLADGSVTDLKLATSSVTTIKIADGAVSTVKLADGSVVNSKIAADSITGTKILDGSIASADIADGAISTIKLGDNAITSAKILDGTITSTDIADASITFAKLANCSANQILKNNGTGWLCAADQDALSNLTCSTNQVLWWDSALSTWQCSQLNTYNITDGTISLVDLATNSVSSAKIVDGTISGSDLAANAISTGHILDGTILFGDLASNGCASNQIIKFSGSGWICGSDNDTTTNYTAGSAINIVSNTISVGADAINYTELSDSLALDATTTTSLGSNNLVTNLNSSGDFLIQDSGTTVLSVLDDGSFLHKNAVNSANAFKVENSTGADLFKIDTTASSIQIGDILADGIAALLILDTKNTAGDPAGSNGAMYYNSVAGKFRCYENGAWVNCINTGTSGIGVTSANVVGVAPNGGSQPNNGMTAVPELDISVPAGKTVSAQYNLSYRIGIPAYAISINFPDYISGQSITGKTSWQNFNGGASTEGNWYAWAHSPETPSFTRGTFDSGMSKSDNNSVIVNITWTNNTASTVNWTLEFGTDVNANVSSAVPRVNAGSSVKYTIN